MLPSRTFIRYFEAYNDNYCTMYVTDHMQGLVKPAISFLELQKMIILKNILLRAVTSRGNSLSMYSQTSQILDKTPSSVTCPRVIESPHMNISSKRTKQYRLLVNLVYALYTRVWSQWTTRQIKWKRIWTIFKHKNKYHKPRLILDTYCMRDLH